jgi:hypothetical protein
MVICRHATTAIVTTAMATTAIVMTICQQAVMATCLQRPLLQRPALARREHGREARLAVVYDMGVSLVAVDEGEHACGW